MKVHFMNIHEPVHLSSFCTHGKNLLWQGYRRPFLQNGAFMNGVASYPRVVNGYNELRRRGTAPVTQIDLCSGGQQATWYMGTPPK